MHGRGLDPVPLVPVSKMGARHSGRHVHVPCRQFKEYGIGSTHTLVCALMQGVPVGHAACLSLIPEVLQAMSAYAGTTCSRLGIPDCIPLRFGLKHRDPCPHKTYDRHGMQCKNGNRRLSCRCGGTLTYSPLSCYTGITRAPRCQSENPLRQA